MKKVVNFLSMVVFLLSISQYFFTSRDLTSLLEKKTCWDYARHAHDLVFLEQEKTGVATWDLKDGRINSSEVYKQARCPQGGEYFLDVKKDRNLYKCSIHGIFKPPISIKDSSHKNPYKENIIELSAKVKNYKLVVSITIAFCILFNLIVYVVWRKK